MEIYRNTYRNTPESVTWGVNHGIWGSEFDGNLWEYLQECSESVTWGGESWYLG